LFSLRFLQLDLVLFDANVNLLRSTAVSDFFRAVNFANLYLPVYTRQ